MKKQMYYKESARKELQALHPAEQLYQLILDHAHDLIAIHRASDLSYEYVNPATLKVLGYTREELFACNPLDLIHPADINKAVAHLREGLPRGLGQGEIRYRKKDGSYVWLEVVGTVMPAESDYISIAIISRDISKRKKTEEALSKAHEELALKVEERNSQLNQINEQLNEKIAELMRTEEALGISENYYRAIFENTGTATAIVDKDTKIIGANLKAAQLAGYTQNELIGCNPCEKFVAPEYLDIVQENLRLRKVDPNAAPQDYEIKCIDKHGRIKNVVMNVANVPDSENLIVSIRDITTWKQAEAALARQSASQALILEISKNFNNIVDKNIDTMINNALRMIAEFDNNDRSYVFLLSADGTTVNNTHEWCARDIPTKRDSLQDIPITALPWWMERLRSNECIYIPRVDDLSVAAQSEKEILRAQAIKSVLAVPMILEDEILGFIGFASDRNEKRWSKGNIIILESVAQIIAKALDRKSFAQAIQDSENYYRTIFENTGAVTLITEEDMTISMVNEECQHFLGYTKEDLIGSKWTDIMPPDFAGRMKEYHAIRQHDSSAAPRKYPARLLDKQGKVREGMCTAAVIPGTKSTVATFVDMTDYKRIDRDLKAISAVNMAMIDTDKEYELLESVCQKIVEVGGYSLAWVGFVQEDSPQKVQPVAYAGRDDGYLSAINISLTDPERCQGPTGTALINGKTVVASNLKTDPAFKPWAREALRRGYKSSMAIPLMANDQILGVLNIYADEPEFFDCEEEKRIVEIANDLAYAIMSRRTREEYNQAAHKLGMSLEKMQRILMQAVTSLGTALEVRDPYTAGHQKKVVCLAAAIAQEMGLSANQIEGIMVAGNLHDIGKIKVPSEILNKPGKLSDLEFELIATHCQAGYEIIKEIEFPWPVAEVILQHHERMNGSGYPRNLKGDQILLEARIMAVADVVEAMASHRPYRPALGIDAALDEIFINRGILYDPDAVDACLTLFREKGFQFE